MQKYHVFLEKKASKQLEKLNVDAHIRVVEALHILQERASPEDLTSQSYEDTKISIGSG